LGDNLTIIITCPQTVGAAPKIVRCPFLSGVPGGMAGVTPARYTMQARDPPDGKQARLYNGADASRVLEVLARGGSKHCGDFCGDLPSISVSLSNGNWIAS